MAKYLLSAGGGGTGGEPMTEEQMRTAYEPIQAVEEEMKAAGAWYFSGRLHDADTATVVRVVDGDVLTTDGPFAESKEHLGGFYIIEAADLDDALRWASKVTAVVGKPIEVRAFAGTAGP